MIVRACTLCLLVLLGAVFLPTSRAGAAGGSVAVSVYDGRLSHIDSPPTGQDVRLLKSLAFSKVQAVAGPDRNSKVLCVARGQFTRKGHFQRAFLCRYSETGHNLATNGIVVLEGSRLVANFVYEGGWEYGLVTLPDLTGDGRNELALEGGSTNQGITQGFVSVLAISADSVRKFGTLDVYHSNEGTVEKLKRETASRVLVKPGKKPQFLLETYERVKNVWKRIGEPKVVKPNEDMSEYSVVE